MLGYTYTLGETQMVAEFIKNVTKLLKDTKLPSIKEFEIVLVPILKQEHLYLVSFDLKETKIYMIDNSANDDITDYQKYQCWPEKTRNALAGYLKSVNRPKADALKSAAPVRMKMDWRTEKNTTDCGIFCMRHMETYISQPADKWNCGFDKEYSKQPSQLEDLRRKYIAKILLHNLNERKQFVIDEAKSYSYLTAATKREIYNTSLARIKRRIASIGV